jgi:hypothetical protein
MLLELGNVFRFIDEFIAQKLHEPAALIGPQRVEKPPPSRRQNFRKRHIRILLVSYRREVSLLEPLAPGVFYSNSVLEPSQASELRQIASRAVVSRDYSNMRAQVEIMHSQAAQRYLQERAVRDHGWNFKPHNLFFFDEPFAVARHAWKKPLATGAAAARTGRAARNGDRSHAAFGRLLGGQDDLDIQAFASLIRRSAGAG